MTKENDIKKMVLICMCVIFVVILNLAITNSRAGKLSPETKSVIDSVIRAYEAEKNTYKTGTGIAKVSKVQKDDSDISEDIFEKEEYTATFWFKGAARRTDFLIDENKYENKKGVLRTLDRSLDRSWSDDGEFCYMLGRTFGPAVIKTSGGEKYRMGEDFHPDAYGKLSGNLPISTMLKNMTVKGDLDIQFTEKGLLEIVHNLNGKYSFRGNLTDISATLYLLLDPDNLYRICEYRMEQNNVNGPGSVEIEHIVINWSDSFNKTYPKSITCKFKQIFSPDILETKKKRGVEFSEAEVSTKIEIEDFHPNVEIADDVFTLSGMGIKPGVMVDDQILGIVYTHGPKGEKIGVSENRCSRSCFVPKQPPSLVSKSLPELNDFKIVPPPADANDRIILVCFWDMQQRPSQHCVKQLAKQAEQLSRKGVTVVAVQASKVDEIKLDEWIEKYNIDFSVGMIQGDEERIRFNWGVKSLPWLILTNKNHVVIAEGFALYEINEKIKQIAK